MYINDKNYKVKFKGDSIIWLMPGLWVNAYYDTSLGYQIEFVEEIE